MAAALVSTMIPARIFPAVGIRSTPCPSTVGSGAFWLLTAMTALVMFVAPGCCNGVCRFIITCESHSSSAAFPQPAQTAASRLAISLPWSPKSDVCPKSLRFRSRPPSGAVFPPPARTLLLLTHAGADPYRVSPIAAQGLPLMPSQRFRGVLIIWYAQTIIVARELGLWLNSGSEVDTTSPPREAIKNVLQLARTTDIESVGRACDLC